MKNKILFTLLILILFLSSCNNKESNTWLEEANGIWKYSIGDNNEFNLLKAANAKPNFLKLNDFDPINFPFNSDEIKITERDNKIYLRFTLEKDEQIYGLGLQFKDVIRNQKIYNMRVDHYGGEDNGRTHAPVPFYISSKGYGVLVNSAHYMTIYVGTSVLKDSKNPPKVYDRNTDKDWSAQPESDMIEILVDGPNAEIVLFNAKSKMDVVRKYNLYSGGGSLPPKWGLGFTYRTHTLYSDEQVLNLVEEFEKKGFPLDFVGLEPGWMNMSYPCSFEWDEERFPDPEKLVGKLLSKGVRTNLWMNPYIAPKAQLYDSMYKYSGTHTVWNGIVPDYSLNEPRQIINEFFSKTHLDIGVSGFKIDEVDGYDNWLWPDVATFPSGKTAEQMRQTYGLLLQDLIFDMYHHKNQRTYGLIRASNAGASRFPFVIYNDYYKHEDFISALINSSFSGVLWTPEVRSSATGEEWLRRMQSVCFSPMAMINAWFSGTLPWSYPEVYNEVKSIAMLRMQLLPYIYSTFAEYHFEGTPPVRAMQLIDDFVVQIKNEKGKLDDTLNPYNIATRKDIKDQFMFGENLLVAPVFTGQKNREVILPKGKWYDFYTGEFIGENEIIKINTKLDQIPLFVKDGGIIPMIKPRLHMPNKGEKIELEIRHYGKSESSFMLYDDDGETFNYEKGEYSWTELSAINSIDNQLVGKFNLKEGNIFNYNNVSWKFMTE
ncbi:MAG: glycoside hydrolase family 31 protein [Ignavibacteriales bacterium]|nr:glycoside hydrolase family 31 protein [Ignavibacteriales bacterium]